MEIPLFHAHMAQLFRPVARFRAYITGIAIGRGTERQAGDTIRIIVGKLDTDMPSQRLPGPVDALDCQAIQ